MELGWVSDHGLPHSYLLDWEPEDRAKLHAYLLEESLRCVSCGTSAWEWDPAQEGGRRDAYVPQEKFCQGCYLKAMQAEDNDSLKGTTVELAPNTPELQERIRVAGLRKMKEDRERRKEQMREREEENRRRERV